MRVGVMSGHMEYHEAVTYLDSLRHFRPKLGTETTEAMLEHLGADPAAVQFVQVAGSNGKGSTSRMLESILREAGLTVGLYTSPDLADVRERIRIDGRSIAGSSLADLVASLRPYVVDRSVAGAAPTFFEAITAIAIAHFVRRDVDVAVLEVGIGGRYDATSAIDPVASAVTSVSLEHTDIIGETVSEIARDKAHVAPVDRPLVTGATRAALDAIRDRTAVITVGQDDADVRTTYHGLDSQTESLIAIDGHGLDVQTRLPLLGVHQTTNAGIAAVLSRQVADVDDQTVARGLRKAEWPGRFEVMEREPLVVIDGAHNPAACETLADLLGQFEYQDLHLVFGAMRDKDHEGMRVALPTPDAVYPCRPDLDRAETLDTLTALFERSEAGRVSATDSVLGAVQAAVANADEADLVLVTGSLFTVAEARDRWSALSVPTDPTTISAANRLMAGANVPRIVRDRSAPRVVHETLRIGVRPQLAAAIQTAMHDVAGDCAVTGVGSANGRVEVVLSGTSHQFHRLTDDLADRTPALEHLADRIQQTVQSPEDSASHLPWAESPAIMGVLNVTPDSFYDGGKYFQVEDAVSHAKALVRAGAAIVDVGGESTRPGGDPVPVQEEIDRVLPVVEAIADVDATISVDTRKAAVAEATLAAGADMINDVSGLADPEMRFVIAQHDVPVVVMHSLGTPVDPERRRAVTYDDVVHRVLTELRERVLSAERAGVDRERIIIDPGLGFGKAATESFELVSRLDELRALGCPMMVGHSRKSMFDEVGCGSGERLPPTIAVTAMAAERGADVIRVHDVAENAAAVRTATAVTTHQ